jgi:serine/threonine protein kinase
MEFIDGPTLRQWIDEHPTPEIADVQDIVEQIAAGLRSFHRRETLHQDLKPENVLLTRDGVVKLIDFGSCHVAGILEIAAPLERDRVLGTASYSAPETRVGENAGIRSELFSLGTLAYEMLTGALPYGDKIETARSQAAFERLDYTPSHHRNPMVPPWMDGALRAAVAIPPRRRYAEISEFLYDLRHPNPAYLRERPLPLLERDPLRFWKGLSALLAALLGAVLWFLL